MKFILPLLLSVSLPSLTAAEVKSHPPLHRPVLSNDSEPVKGPAYYVDAGTGDDTNEGSIDRPWKTIQHALVQLSPGDTLLLRGGTYFENVYCAIAGTSEKPITIRSHPGETAIIDGGFPEFQNDPAQAWEPGKEEGEFVSRKQYRNIRDVLGLFEDSNVGLQTYWHLNYLTSTNELTGKGNSIPFYCGPGIYYDQSTGRIHIRLAHTYQKAAGFVNYAGETDPRKVPLVIAPFRSVPLHLDLARHLRFKDLVIRGGGFNTLLMTFAIDVAFDHVTVYGGTYCIRAKNSGPVELTNCGIIGQIPPWGYWSDNALHTYDPVYYDPYTQPPEPRSARNVARLPTHALIVTEGAEESDVFAYPYNNHWKISQCEFSDGHDGIYLNGQGMELSHCLVTRIQDDGFYLSTPTPQGINADIHLHHNYVNGAMTPFGAHLRGASTGDCYIYGNIVDMRHLTQMTRPTAENPEGRFTSGALFLAHGRGSVAGIDNILFCYNTFILSGKQFAGATVARTTPDSVRGVFNNIFVYVQQLPALSAKSGIQGRTNIDGNLHWFIENAEPPANWWQTIRESEASRENVEKWQGLPWAVHSKYGNPDFVDWNPTRLAGNDYRLKPNSPARGMAVDFPQKSRLRDFEITDTVGALPNDQPLKVGIDLRFTAGQ